MRSLVITKLITQSKEKQWLLEVKDAEVQFLGVQSSHDQLQYAL